MNITNMSCYKYKKYAKASGMVDLRLDAVQQSKLINKNLRKSYIKSYLKLLSE